MSSFIERLRLPPDAPPLTPKRGGFVYVATSGSAAHGPLFSLWCKVGLTCKHKPRVLDHYGRRKWAEQLRVKCPDPRWVERMAHYLLSHSSPDDRLRGANGRLVAEAFRVDVVTAETAVRAALRCYQLSYVATHARPLPEVQGVSPPPEPKKPTTERIYSVDRGHETRHRWDPVVADVAPGLIHVESAAEVTALSAWMIAFDVSFDEFKRRTMMGNDCAYKLINGNNRIRSKARFANMMTGLRYIVLRLGAKYTHWTFVVRDNGAVEAWGQGKEVQS